MSTHGARDGAYRIIDEESQGLKSEKSAPWSPRFLFFMTWGLFIFSGFGAAVGLFFSALNWARLGHAAKRLPWIGLSVFALALPFALLYLRNANGFPGIELGRTIKTVVVFALAFWALLGQRPLFESHVARGGQVAKPWALWLAIFALGALTFWAGVQKKNREAQNVTTFIRREAPVQKPVE